MSKPIEHRLNVTITPYGSIEQPRFAWDVHVGKSHVPDLPTKPPRVTWECVGSGVEDSYEDALRVTLACLEDYRNKHAQTITENILQSIAARGDA